MDKPLETELWRNIRNFSFDDRTSSFPFSKKLQQENNWSSEFTAQAIEEYRRFIFLCCILPNGASPSETVDKVWHLHLTYTDNYWNKFCRQTLGKDIHHHPSKGGAGEQLKHTNWYQQTLQEYRRIFSAEPPANIWPTVPTDAPALEIDIYDRDFFNRIVLVFVVLTVLYVLVLNIFHSAGPDFLGYYFFLMAAGIIVSWVLQDHKQKKLDGYSNELFPDTFNSFQVAWFLYGKHRAYQIALVDLLRRAIIDTAGDRYKVVTYPTSEPTEEDNPLLPLLSQNFVEGKTFSYRDGLDCIDLSKVEHPGFNQLTRLSKKVDYQKFVVPGVVLAIGFARLFQGMANEKPVGFLVAEIGLFSLISLMIAAQYSYTYLVFKKSETIWKGLYASWKGNPVLNNYTVLGVSAIAGFAEYGLLADMFAKEAPERRGSDAGSSWDSSGSCSSGGDSGCGGGGCGGCGGGD